MSSQNRDSSPRMSQSLRYGTARPDLSELNDRGSDDENVNSRSRLGFDFNRANRTRAGNTGATPNQNRNMNAGIQGNQTQPPLLSDNTAFRTNPTGGMNFNFNQHPQQNQQSQRAGPHGNAFLHGSFNSPSPLAQSPINQPPATGPNLQHTEMPNQNPPPFNNPYGAPYTQTPTNNQSPTTPNLQHVEIPSHITPPLTNTYVAPLGTTPQAPTQVIGAGNGRPSSNNSDMPFNAAQPQSNNSPSSFGSQFRTQGQIGTAKKTSSLNFSFGNNQNRQSPSSFSPGTVIPSTQSSLSDASSSLTKTSPLSPQSSSEDINLNQNFDKAPSSPLTNPILPNDQGFPKTPLFNNATDNEGPPMAFYASPPPLQTAHPLQFNQPYGAPPPLQVTPPGVAPPLHTSPPNTGFSNIQNKMPETPSQSPPSPVIQSVIPPPSSAPLIHQEIPPIQHPVASPLSPSNISPLMEHQANATSQVNFNQSSQNNPDAPPLFMQSSSRSNPDLANQTNQTQQKPAPKKNKMDFFKTATLPNVRNTQKSSFSFQSTPPAAQEQPVPSPPLLQPANEQPAANQPFLRPANEQPVTNQPFLRQHNEQHSNNFPPPPPPNQTAEPKKEEFSFDALRSTLASQQNLETDKTPILSAQQTGTQSSPNFSTTKPDVPSKGGFSFSFNTSKGPPTPPIKPPSNFQTSSSLQPPSLMGEDDEDSSDDEQPQDYNPDSNPDVFNSLAPGQWEKKKTQRSSSIHGSQKPEMSQQLSQEMEMRRQNRRQTVRTFTPIQKSGSQTNLSLNNPSAAYQSTPAPTLNTASLGPGDNLMDRIRRRSDRATFDDTQIPEYSEENDILIPEIKINVEEFRRNDEPITQMLYTDQALSLYRWAEQVIMECREEPNPYNDPSAVKHQQQPLFETSRIVRLFSSQTKTLIMNKLYDPPLTKVSARPLIFKSDVKSPSDVKPPELDPSYHPESCYFIDNPELEIAKFQLEPFAITGLNHSRYLYLNITNFKLNVDIIEPIFCSCFLFTQNNIISEEWFFTPFDVLKTYENEIDAIRKQNAAFVISDKLDYSQPIYLVVLYHRPLCVDAGSAINKYYQNPKPKSKEEAEKISKDWRKMKNILTTFACSSLPINEFVTSKTLTHTNYVFPGPFKLSGPITSSILKSSTQNFKFELTMAANIKATAHDEDIKIAGQQIEIYHSILPDLVEPIIKFNHKFYIRLDNIDFKTGTDGRNILIEVSTKVNGQPQPFIISRETNQITDHTTSRVWYHNKKPIFNEVIVLQLPYHVDKEFSVVFDIYHAVAKTIKEKEKVKIGTGILKLKNIDDSYITDGEHEVVVTYDENANKPGNRDAIVTIWTKFQSNICSPDPNLNALLQNHDVNGIGQCDPTIAVQNAFTIVDQLFMLIKSKPFEAVRGFSSFIQTVQNIMPIKTFLMNFAHNFAFWNQEDVNPQFHRALFIGWAQFLKEYPDKNDDIIRDFFFIILIKSLHLTKDYGFNDEFCEFIGQWSRFIAMVNRDVAVAAVQSYARFIYFLFDIKLYSYAIQAVDTQLVALGMRQGDFIITMDFINEVFRPKLFFASTVHLDSFVSVIINAIERAITHPMNTELQDIFRILLREFTLFTTTDMATMLADRLLFSLDTCSPLDRKELIFAGSRDPHPILSYFQFIISNVSRDSFENWWGLTNKESFFKSLHFIISTLNQEKKPEGRIKEIIYAAQFSILNAIQLIADIQDNRSIIESTEVIYHLFCTNIANDVYPRIYKILSQIASQNIELIINDCKPILTRLMIKILTQSCYSPIHSDKFIQLLFDIDPNRLRIRAVIARALHSLTYQDLRKVTLSPKNYFHPTTQKLTVIMGRLFKKENLDDETLCELYYRRSRTIIDSPDAVVDTLNDLIKYYSENEYYCEEIQTLILQAIVVLEYLMIQGRASPQLSVLMPVLVDLCPIAKMFKYSNASAFSMPSYCDSVMFSERSLICHMKHILDRCKETKEYEMCYNLIDALWPLFEHHRMMSHLKSLFDYLSNVYQSISEIPLETDRMFGRYFRVTFYGKIFGPKDGTIYIYREKQLTHLYEVSARMVEKFKAITGKNIELIKESGSVDKKQFNPETGYIQVTFVEPHVAKDRTRLTQYEKGHNINTFFFDTPFTKEGGVQGAVEQQWIRRTLLNVQHPMPTALKRQVVKPDNIIEKEFEPIRVSYRQLRERISMIESAIAQQDPRQIQQLLHGSLLVQVNEGPSKMAEVFLSDEAIRNDPTNKYIEKLKKAFKVFLDVNEKGLVLHAKWVAENTAFIPLQHELESGFLSLVEKLSTYIGK